MSELKKIFKTIEAGLPKKGIGVDVTDLVDSRLLNKLAGDELSIGVASDSLEKLKPLANLSFKKGQIQGGIGGAGKDDFGAGILYNTEDTLGSASLNFSKTPQGGSSLMFKGTKRFKQGGAVQIGKGKDYIKDLI